MICVIAIRYVASSYTAAKLIRLCKFMGERRQSKCRRLIKNAEHHEKTKHIEVKFHFIRELVENGITEV